MAAQIKASDFIVSFLSANGINKCFCVTGGGAMHLNDSFGHSPDFITIYNHHEQACSMAAEGYTRTSNIPAVVCVTSGPGSTNAITGVFGAWLDSIPMIVISGQMKQETTLGSQPLPLRYLGFQEADIINMVSPITKYAVKINSINDLEFHLNKAMFLANSGRKGPVWLDIPLDIQGEMMPSTYDRKLNLNFMMPPTISDLTISLDQMELFFKKLNSSKRPVLMLGEEVRHSHAENLIENLTSKLGIPAVTEWNSHDLVDQENPFESGRPGTIGNRGGNYVVQTADLLIMIGCQLSIRQISYEWQNFAKNAYKIAVNIDENELQKPTLNIDMPLNYDTKVFINEILKSSIPITNFSLWTNKCKKINTKYPVSIKENYANNEKINVYTFMSKLSKNLPKKSTVVLANGAACVAGLQALEVRNELRLFTNAGASSMGYGIAASIGASLGANSNSRSPSTICIEGDGSIMMNLQELQTIVENNLNIKIFIINNDGYHSIKQTQKNLFSAETRGYCGAGRSSGLSLPDFEGIARGFKIKYFKISDNNELDSEIMKCLNHPSFAICEVYTDPDQDFAPKLASKVGDDGKMFSPSLEEMSPFLPDDEHKDNLKFLLE